MYSSMPSAGTLIVDSSKIFISDILIKIGTQRFVLFSFLHLGTDKQESVLLVTTLPLLSYELSEACCRYISQARMTDLYRGSIPLWGIRPFSFYSQNFHASKCFINQLYSKNIL